MSASHSAASTSRPLPKSSRKQANPTHASSRHYQQEQQSIPIVPQTLLKSSHSSQKTNGGILGDQESGTPIVVGGRAAPKKKVSCSRSKTPAGIATQSSKKSTLDKQTTFVNLVLPQELEKGLNMEETPTLATSFYNNHVLPILNNELDQVRTIKTGGPTPPPLKRFEILNKDCKLSPSTMEISQDIKSIKHMKFLKMILWKSMDILNTSLKAAGYKGKIYLRKYFYADLERHWVEFIEPIMVERKEEERVREDKERVREEEQRKAEEMLMRMSGAGIDEMSDPEIDSISVFDDSPLDLPPTLDMDL